MAIADLGHNVVQPSLVDNAKKGILTECCKILYKQESIIGRCVQPVAPIVRAEVNKFEKGFDMATRWY